MQPNHQTWTWDTADGAVTSMNDLVLSAPVTALHEGLVESAVNWDFAERSLGAPRRGASLFDDTGTEPTKGIRYLFNEGNDAALWAFDSNGTTAMTASRYASGTWSSITLSDTVATLAQPHAVAYNGKVFLAYDSDVNRLHVWDGTSVRRVGVVASAAATVANTGAGAYAATIRYYKIQFFILSGTTKIASSELSDAVSFTPSGAGSAARVTKPTTPDSATHWRVWVSPDGLTYYSPPGTEIAVGTTTFDDTFAPSDYANPANDIAPVAGLYVPPPSAKYLATDGTRVIMAGAWESSASSGQTTPSARRVWFTRPLGATDEGDDESITQTVDNRYWIDIDDPSGSPITGLSALGGLVYVFFARSIWRLIPTGQPDVPFRAEQVATGAGAVSQYALCVGGMDATQAGPTDEAIYFLSALVGFYRYSPSRGLEWLGRDVVPEAPVSPVTAFVLAYDASRRDVWMIGSGTWVFDVTRLMRRGHEYHGGAREYTGLTGNCGTYYNGFMVIGSGTTTDSLLTMSLGATDVGADVTGTLRSAAFSVPGKLISAEAPTVTAYLLDNTTTTLTCRYINAYNAETRAQSVTYVGSQDRVQFRFDALAMSDAVALQVEIEFVSDVTTENPHRIERVVVPYRVQEAA